MSPTHATAVRALPGAIVFTDIAGFTEFTAVRGDEAALALLALQERLARRSGEVPRAGSRPAGAGSGGPRGASLPGVFFEEVGPVVMRGIPAPIALYRA